MDSWVFWFEKHPLDFGMLWARVSFWLLSFRLDFEHLETLVDLWFVEGWYFMRRPSCWEAQVYSSFMAVNQDIVVLLEVFSQENGNSHAGYNVCFLFEVQHFTL